MTLRPKVCVVGSGGREHALSVALGQDSDVVVSPGNPGIGGSTDVAPETIEADLFVVGPELPLVDGLADRLREQGKLVFGPGSDGARLEGSKAWMKDLLVDAGVPTARYGTFTEVGPALSFLDTMPLPYVIKTDGLAAGKGVLVTESRMKAEEAIDSYLAGDAFGAAGKTVVIEEGLIGPELSLLTVCDGTKAVALAPAQDFKRLGDGDTGPNTGGMGAYSPVPAASDVLVIDIMNNFIQPTIDRLNHRGVDYRGVLYAGLMLTVEGPKILEYNVRFGDPETQVVLPRLESSLTELLMEAAAGKIESSPVFSSDAMVTIVCAAPGYPDRPHTGDEVLGLEDAESVDGVSVTLAGVAVDQDSRLRTAGGRVLNVTGRGPSLTDARCRAYEAVRHISWPGIQIRQDIALAASGQEV